MLEEEKRPISKVNPFNEHEEVTVDIENVTGTHVNISGMAMAKYSPNKDNAVKLMEFLTGDKAPINKRWNIEQLLNTLREYPRLSNSERITFEYVMLKDVNDTDADARRLVKLIQGIPAKINLIPFNEWPGAPYQRSDWPRIKQFADIIYKAGYASPIRTPRGEDIMAACGQLKSATERARKSRKQIEAETGLGGAA